MKTRDLTLCAMFTGMTVLCAWLQIPLPGVALTMQTFAISLTLLCLGGKRGCASILAYLLLGAVGLPVFSGFQGGLSALFSPTGGYLWGFWLGGLLYWLLTEKNAHPLFALICAIAISYLCGTWFYAYGYLGGKQSLGAAFFQCIAPFLAPDALKVGLAWILSKKLPV